MRISWEDIDKYGNHYKLVENYSVYGIFFDCADDMEKARKQFRNLYSRMVYSVRKDEKYKDVAFILGLSCHDGKTCYKVQQKSGSRGRPKQRVVGKSTKKHIHGYISMSIESKGLYTLVEQIVDKENARQQKRGLKQGRFWRNSNKENHNLCCMPVEYVRSQSEPNFYYEYGDVSPFEND